MTDTEIQINGMAHVILCVSDFGAARKFYKRLLPALGMTPVGLALPFWALARLGYREWLSEIYGF